MENKIEALVESIDANINMDSRKENDTLESLIEMTKRISQLKSVFKFPLGCRVRNRHNEDGYIEICAVDFRGILYRVNLQGKSVWYSEFEIKRVDFNYDEPPKEKKEDPRIKTDVDDRLIPKQEHKPKWKNPDLKGDD